jgi:hypothetical protein
MRSLVIATMVVCFVPAVRAADDENPFKKAKVGDWAEYKMTTMARGQTFEGKTKMTVIDKDDKEAILELKGALSINGAEKELPTKKQTIDLAKPYDFAAMNNTGKTAKSADAKTEKLGDGKEKVTVAGKQYNANWTKTKTTAKAGGKSIETEIKVWTSKDAPLSGMIKMEVKSSYISMTMEMVGSGSK